MGVAQTDKPVYTGCRSPTCIVAETHSLLSCRAQGPQLQLLLVIQIFGASL